MEYSYLLTLYFVSLLVGFYATRSLSSLWDAVISCLYLSAFIVIVATRPETTPDTISYLEFFEVIKNNHYNLGLTRIVTEFEIGFTNLTVFFANMGITATTYFGIISGVQITISTLALRSIVSIVSETLKNTTKLIPILTLYLPCYGFMYASIVLRAGLAISLTLLSLAFFLERRYGFAALMYLVALSFHDTALIFLAVFLLFVFLPDMTKAWTLRFAIILNILVMLRIFDKIIAAVYKIATFFTSHVGVLMRFSVYLNFPRRDTAYSRPILFFSLQILYATIMLSNEGGLMDKILKVGIAAGLVGSFFGSLTEYKRVYDILFLVMLAPIIMTLNVGYHRDVEGSWIETLLNSKKIRYLGFGLISSLNMYSFLGFSSLR